MLPGTIAWSQTTVDSLALLSNGFLKVSPFCQPFVSETENYRTQVGVLYATNREEYDVTSSHSPYDLFQYTTAGAEIPIYRRFQLDGKTPEYGLAFTAALGFHLWWDPFEWYTSPILSVDYRIAPLQIKYIRFLRGRQLKNYSLKLVPYNHESTHIGDDLTLYRVKKNYPITRVNVSYAYSELHFTLNDPMAGNEQNHAFRAGLSYKLNRNKDYYSINEGEGDPGLAGLTGIRTEYFVQYHLIRAKGWLTWKNWTNVFSLELRNRARYQYPLFSTISGSMEMIEPGPSRANTVNLYLGYRYIKQKGPTLGFYLHGYYGINPYGQFRNQSDFRSMGLSIVLE